MLHASDGRLVVVGEPEAPARHTDRHGDAAAPAAAVVSSAASSAPSILRRGQLEHRRRRPAAARLAFMVNALRAGTIVAVVGRGARLVHGAAPPVLRRAHAGDRVVSRARRPRSCSGSARPPATSPPPSRPRSSSRPCPARSAGGPEQRVRGHRHRAGVRAGLRRAVRQPLRRLPQRADRACCSAPSSASRPARCWRCSWWPSSRWPCSPLIGRPLFFATVDPDVAAARGVPVRLLGDRLPGPARLRGGRGQPDHRRAAGLRAAGDAGRRPRSSSRPGRGELLRSRSLLGLLTVVARPGRRLLLGLSGRLLHHDASGSAATCSPRRGRRSGLARWPAAWPA